MHKVIQVPYQSSHW